MRFALSAVLFLFVFASSASAANVIFVTLDGVRFQEFFKGVRKPHRAGMPRGTDLFPEIRASAKRGESWIFGDGHSTGTFRIGDRAALSLPGYRAILSGEYEDRCRENRCGNIDHETLFDGLIDRGFAREDLAAFASWPGLGFALEKTPGQILRDVDHDVYPVENPSVSEKDEAEKIARASLGDLSEWGYRRDRYTYALGRLFLANHRPRILYLAFGDSDEYGHLKEYRNYVDSLVEYDHWIAELREALSKMGEYGAETSIVVTTDHGRGRGFLWYQHGNCSPSSFRTWAVVIPSPRLLESGARPRVAVNYTQLDLRPTLEELLGVPTTTDVLHPGRSIIEPGASLRSSMRASRN